MKILDSSVLLIMGGGFGWLINTFLTTRSQKITLDNFYAEPFLKIKAERIIKALDTLNLMTRYWNNLLKSPELINPELINPEIINKFNEQVSELSGIIYSLRGHIEEDKREQLIKVYDELNEIAGKKGQDSAKFVKVLNDAVNMLAGFFPEDFKFKN